MRDEQEKSKVKAPPFAKTKSQRVGHPPEQSYRIKAAPPAHSALNARDIAYYDQALKLKGPDALNNADSYRIFAEHIHVTQ
jgi:hypothetical protein